VVDAAGGEVGRGDAVELVTIGQRKGLGLAGGSEPRFVVSADPVAAEVVVGTADDLLVGHQSVQDVAWVAGPVAGEVLVQTSAHGAASRATVGPTADPGRVELRWHERRRRVAEGQSVVLYTGDDVIGGGIAASGQ
jgi:tRNA-specific 2-thiouridylase